jgi:Raf kinase inhibitor-like YbhB/YbcL family protein
MKSASLGFVPVPIVLAMVICGCQSKDPTAHGEPETVESDQAQGRSGQEVKRMQLTSSFENGATIDKKHTGEGPDTSPPLSWSGAPDATVSFALICDDPDAPSPRKPRPNPWVHWVIYNIPASVSELPEAVSPVAEPPEIPGAKQGKNEFPNVGYNGPMPPPGSGTHRYFFRLYALDAELDLDPDKATKKTLLEAMKGHIVAEGQLMGKYERQ